MAIKASSRKTIETLAVDLSSGRAATRDAAVARLIVIGARAVEALAQVAADPSVPSVGRVAAIKGIEAIGDARGLDAVLRASGDSSVEVANAAIGAASLFLHQARGVEVVERLTDIALDRRQAAAVRRAAVQALGGLRASTVAPLVKALAADPDPEISALARAPAKPRARTSGDVTTWAEGDLPEDPEDVRRVVGSDAGMRAPFGTLHSLIQRVREREASETAQRRAAWTRARAAVHLALASRGSRVALYDIRDTLEAAQEPLPVDFLSALAEAGDRSCLEAIAAAHARTLRKRDTEWWRDHLADAFQAIMAREQLTRRHAAIRKIQKRWPAVIDASFSAHPPATRARRR